MCSCLSCAPHRGPGQEARCAPWLGIESGTLWFTGQRSIHWATPARATSWILMTYVWNVFRLKRWILSNFSTCSIFFSMVSPLRRWRRWYGICKILRHTYFPIYLGKWVHLPVGISWGWGLTLGMHRVPFVQKTSHEKWNTLITS